MALFFPMKTFSMSRLVDHLQVITARSCTRILDRDLQRSLLVFQYINQSLCSFITFSQEMDNNLSMNRDEVDDSTWPEIVPPPPPLILRGIEKLEIAKWITRYIHFQEPVSAEEDAWREFVRSEIQVAGGLSDGWDPEGDLMHVLVWRLLNDDKMD